MEFNEKEKEIINNLSPVLKAILNKFIKLIEQIVNGDCHYNEEHSKEILESISILVCPEKRLSKYQAANKIGISPRQFDRYIKMGLIPKGDKQSGFKELSWKQSDINNFMSNKNYHKSL